MNLDELESWVTEEIQCDLCAHKYISVHMGNAPKLECPKCENIANYKVITTMPNLIIKNNEPTK